MTRLLLLFAAIGYAIVCCRSRKPPAMDLKGLEPLASTVRL